MNPALTAELNALAGRVGASTVAVRAGRGGSGSGVVWSADGGIITNAHVVGAERTVEIELADGRTFDGAVERKNDERDLALVRIAATGLPAVLVRDPETLRIGEVLVAVGHPHGVANALTLGIAHNAFGTGNRHFVVADVRLAPGNSGGPLTDVEGRVVGINSMVVAGELALAIPSDDVARFFGTEPSEVPLGVRFANAKMRDGKAAFVIIGVEPDSRAARAGLMLGDVIVARDIELLRNAPVIDVVRGGHPIAVPIPAAQPVSRAA